MEQISNSWVKRAIKSHICSCCGKKINKGDTYYREFIKDGSTVYTWKQCKKCDLIISKLWSWIDPSDGIDSNDFYYMCYDFASEFLCNNCDEFKGEDCTRNDICIDKIYNILKTHNLIYNEHRWELENIS